MKRLGLILVAAVSLASLTGCGDREPTIEERAAEAETCREADGLYVFEKPPGYASAFYHCIWDTSEGTP